MVAHPAEHDRRAGSDTDADQIHKAVAGGPIFGTDDLAEDWHVVAVEKAPTQSEQTHEEYGRAEAPGVAQSEQRGHTEEHTDGARIDAAAEVGAHPAIRQRPAQEHAGKGGKLNIAGGGEAGRAFL